MSEAAHQPSSTTSEANNTPTEPQGQAPSGISQENSSSSIGSEAVSEFGSSDETLRPSDEFQKEEGSGIDRVVWIDTLPFPDCAPPSPSCSKPQRCAKEIRTEDKLHTSPDCSDPSGKISLVVEKTTCDAVKTFPVPPDLSSWGFWNWAGPLPAMKKRQSSASQERGVYNSNRCHQDKEDGRCTPPRRPTIEARSEPLCTSLDSSSDSSSSDSSSSDSSSSDSFARFQKQQQLVFDACKTGLYYTLTGRKDGNRPKTAVLNLVALQRMNILAMQARLANNTAESFQTGRLDPDPEDLQQTLNLYCDGVRNLEFMREKAKLGYDRDPFLMKSSRALERGILESSGLIPHHILPKGELPPPEDHEHPVLANETGGRHHANEMTSKKQRLERSAMASFGGLLIIVPMLIMANVPGKIASLVTSCVAITIFAALVTLVTKLGPHEVLASVAAYAAVLVVFVGLSLEKR